MALVEEVVVVGAVPVCLTEVEVVVVVEAL